MTSLIEAALRDQERRVIEAEPKSFRQTKGPHLRLGNCTVCGAWLAAHNRTGLCSRTPACRAAQEKRRHAAKKAKG